MLFHTHFDATVDVTITKIEKEKYSLLLDDGDNVLGIVDGELLKLCVCEYENGGESLIKFCCLDNKTFHHLDFVYILN